MVVNETGDIVADIEDEPDRGESRNAVKINLHEVSNDVPIEKFHWNNHGRDACGVNFGSAASNLKIHDARIDSVVILRVATDLTNSFSVAKTFAQHDMLPTSLV